MAELKPSILTQPLTCRMQHIKPERKTENVSLLLPQDYICEIPIQTRSKSSSVCSCRWCALARMNGVQFRKWKNSLKKTDQPKVAFSCLRTRGGPTPPLGLSKKCSWLTSYPRSVVCGQEEDQHLPWDSPRSAPG